MSSTLAGKPWPDTWSAPTGTAAAPTWTATRPPCGTGTCCPCPARGTGGAAPTRTNGGPIARPLRSPGFSLRSSAQRVPPLALDPGSRPTLQFPAAPEDPRADGGGRHGLERDVAEGGGAGECMQILQPLGPFAVLLRAGRPEGQLPVDGAFTRQDGVHGPWDVKPRRPPPTTGDLVT